MHRGGRLWHGHDLRLTTWRYPLYVAWMKRRMQEGGLAHQVLGINMRVCNYVYVVIVQLKQVVSHKDMWSRVGG